MKITFAQASPSDFEELLSLRIAAMRESLERIGRFDPERARARFTEGFEAKQTRIILLGEVRIGFIVVKKIASGLLLDHLYVAPKFQSQGIGSFVLKSVFAEADTLGCDLRVGALKES